MTVYSENNEYSFLNGSNFEVRLLVSELKEARKISAVFRQAQIIPHIYDDFNSFYTDSVQSMGHSLSIIDVKKMSHGLIKLKGHPAIKNNTMHLAFYYSDDSIPLLYSTYEIFNFGLLRRCDDYSGQIKSILRRYNLFQIKDAQFSKISQENQENKKTTQNTFNMLENHKESIYFYERFFSICEKFEKEKINISFFEACEDVFDEMPEVKAFSYMELSSGGQKLISPLSGAKKFQKLPSLWLGSEFLEGIEFFAQNMANQVALDVLGPDVMCLMIKGRFNHPDKLLFIKVGNEAFLDNFKWNIFEDYLSNVYSFFLAKQAHQESDDVGYLDNYLFLEKLDASRFQEKGAEELYLVDVSLDGLFSVIESKGDLRFYWKDFFRDFVRYFKGKYNGEFYYTTGHSKHISFLVDHSKSDLFLRAIKDFSKRFSYWRYFEDRDFIFTEDMNVSVRSLPVSSQAYLSYVSGIANIYQTAQQNNIQESFQ